MRARLLHAGHLPHAAALVSLSLAALAAWSLWIKLFPMRDSQSSVRPGAVSLQTSTEYVQPDALSGKIAEQHIFGTANPQTMERMDSPQTDVILDGTVYDSADSTASLAILNINGQEKAYSVGDMLSDGEKLAAISSDSIQLERYGDSRTIRLSIKQADTHSHFDLLAVMGAGDQNTVSYAPGATSARPASVAGPALPIAAAPIPADPLLGRKLLSVKEIRKQRRERFQGMLPGKP